MSEMSRCHHDRSPQSTLQTCYGNGGDGLTVWWVVCRSCGGITNACLTVDEAIARAVHDWWFNIEEGVEMSEIKALDELRDYAEQCCPEYESYDSQMIRIADEIQAEVDKRFIELPVDADGVHIHVGDYLHSDETGRDFPCRGYSYGLNGNTPRWTIECCYDPYSGTSEFVSAKSCHHYEPDSIGRVALDMRDSISEHVGLAPDEVLAFVERLKRLERAE